MFSYFNTKKYTKAGMHMCGYTYTSTGGQYQKTKHEKKSSFLKS